MEEQVRRLFKVLSVENKLEDLGVNLVGYLSVHAVCTLAEDRATLPETSKFEGMKFEIQIRTVLQHAWAEIEHDKRYKFDGKLPDDLSRRVSLLAGCLESADRQFDDVVSEIERYRENVAERIRNGDYALEINTETLQEYIESLVPRWEMGDEVIVNTPDNIRVAVQELGQFGLETIQQVDDLFDAEFIATLKALMRNYQAPLVSELFILRRGMLHADIDKFFEDVGGRMWVFTNFAIADLVRKHGPERVQQRRARSSVEELRMIHNSFFPPLPDDEEVEPVEPDPV